MAKKTTSVPANVATFEITVAMPREIEFNGVSIRLDEVNAAGVAYLLAYGFRQSLQDSVSGVAKDLTALHGAGGGSTETETKRFGDAAGAAGLTVEEALALSAEEFVKKVLHAYMTERRDDIVAGEVTVGGGRGPRLSGIEKIIRDVADEWLKAVYVRSHKEAPKGKDWTAKRDAFVERFRDVAPKGFPSGIKAEAERRMGAMVAAPANEVEDILAGLG